MKLLIVVAIVLTVIGSISGFSINDAPYTASVGVLGIHKCCGYIISTTRVVAPAQCTFLQPIIALLVRAGSSSTQTGGQLSSVNALVPHPSFNPVTLVNDISLIFLVTPLIFGPGVAAAALPAQGANLPVGTMVQQIGWSSTSSSLQAVQMETASAGECSISILGLEIFGLTLVCAKVTAEGPAPCLTDPAALLTVGDMPVGSVSVGLACAIDGTVMFTPTSSHVDWINSNM